MSFGVADKSMYDLCVEALAGEYYCFFFFFVCDDSELMSGATDRAFDQSILCFCAKRISLTSSESAELSIACYLNLVREQSV